VPYVDEDTGILITDEIVIEFDDAEVVFD